MDDLKHCYRNRINQKKSTRWPKLADPTLYVDVTIIRAKFLSERFREDHAMGLVERRHHSYITVDELLEHGYGKVSLIEGDPGAGKTTFTFKICQKWAEDELLIQDIVFWIPLRHYKSVTTTNELFGRLGYPEMMNYAQQFNGKGLVFILDGWDELPNDLQTASLFRDIIFGKIRIFTHSTIIVTSRSSCSSEIAEAVEETNSYYQILGFDREKAVSYINAYFHGDLVSAALLLAFLNNNEYLYQHFYIPISVAIMSYVYRSHGKIPQTLSRLYERFIVLWLRSNIPDMCLHDLSKFKTIHNIPDTMRPAFHKLCKIAFDMLKDNKLVLCEEELEVMQDELDNLLLKQFDGFGLLHVDYYTSSLATMETSYNFIHRSVQELLAAIFILNTDKLSDLLDEYFYNGSYFMNVFPFMFGLASNELVRPLARKLIQIFNKSDRNNELLFSILYCLFEAHEEYLCREFGEVFSEEREIILSHYTLLECHYGCYFIASCGIKRLNITIFNNVSGSCDPFTNVFCKYLQSGSTDIASFHFYGDINGSLSHEGIEQFAKSLSSQNNILSIHLSVSCAPGCVTILCNSICKHNPQITDLMLSPGELNENDLKSVAMILTTLSLNSLFMWCSLSEGMCLDLSLSVCKALCETKSLQKLVLCQWSLSQAESEVFGNGISQNCSLKELHLTVETPDCLCPILNGLSSNTSITTFRVSVIKINTLNTTGDSNLLGQCLEKCFSLNCSMEIMDFITGGVKLSRSLLKIIYYHMIWSSTQVSSICSGLCANTTVVTLDITGCHIDSAACHAICGMLSQNKTLKHLFLNPVHLEKQEAVAMIDSCRANATLELLSLVHWPLKQYSDYVDEIKDDEGKIPYSCDPEIKSVLLKIQKLRKDQEDNKPVLNVYWLVATYIVLMCCYVILSVYRGPIEYFRAMEKILPYPFIP